MDRLFIDDDRFPPNDGYRWQIARSFHTAIHMLEQYHYDVISLDHDIQSFYGNREMTGYDILNWMIEHKERFKGVRVVVHSENWSAVPHMQQDIDKHFPQKS